MRALILTIAATAALHAESVKDFSRTVPLDRNGRLTVDTYKGSIHIAAWDRNEVEIKARIEEDPGWHAIPVEDVDIRVDTSTSSVRVKSDYRRFRNWFSIDGNLPFVHYTIHVPREASLTVKDYKSESEIAGVQGDVEFETYKGDARLEGLRGSLDVNTYRGTITASFASFAKRTRIDTYRGRIDLAIPRAAAFDLETDLQRHADLDCDFPRTVRLAGRQSFVNGKVNGGGPVLRVKSYRGTIRLRAI